MIDIMRHAPNALTSGEMEFLRIGSRGFSPTVLSEVPRTSVKAYRQAFTAIAAHAARG
jgi:hypothetical protein